MNILSLGQIDSTARSTECSQQLQDDLDQLDASIGRFDRHQEYLDSFAKAKTGLFLVPTR